MENVRNIFHRLYRQQEAIARSTARLAHGLHEMGSRFSRAMAHLLHVSKAKTVVIISACRDAGNPDPDVRARNHANTLELASDIRGLGYGYIPAVGVWVENRGKENERRIREPTYIVADMTKDEAATLCSKYQQEGFVWAERGKPWVVLNKDMAPIEGTNWNRVAYDIAGRDAWTEIGGRAFSFGRSEEGLSLRPALDALGEDDYVFPDEAVTTSINDLHEGDLVWWQSQWGTWDGFGCFVEVVSSPKDNTVEVKIVEGGLESCSFVVSRLNTYFVSRVLARKG
jgi:hypothetical protein